MRLLRTTLRTTLKLLIQKLWCREGGSNPHDRKGRRILSLFFGILQGLAHFRRNQHNPFIYSRCSITLDCMMLHRNEPNLGTNRHQNRHQIVQRIPQDCQSATDSSD
jgi:hypothetical protein